MTTPTRPAAVLFDCDGVLVDTEVTSAQVLAEMLVERGVAITADEVRARIKGTSLDFVEAESARLLGGAVPDGWIDDFFARRLVHYRAGVPQMPGAADAVRAVRAAGVLVAVVSQGRHEKMATTLPASGMDAVLAGAPIFSGDDVTRGKPHPDLYLHAAAAIGVEPGACVVVEDSPTGATGAVAAGMRVLGYSPDSDPEAMAATGAEVFYDLREVAWRAGLQAAPTGPSD